MIFRPAAPGFLLLLPAVIADRGERSAERFFTLFTDQLPNASTRGAYCRNTLRVFA